jgi:hypothetical protein
MSVIKIMYMYLGGNTTVLVHLHERGYFHLECRAYVAYFLNFDVLLRFKIKLTLEFIVKKCEIIVQDM